MSFRKSFPFLNKTRLIILLLSACMVGIGLSLMTTPVKTPAKPATEKRQLVEVQTIQRADYAPAFTGQARVEAANETKIHAQVNAVIHTIQVKPGQQVTKGQTLFTLDNRAFEFIVAQQAAELSDAQAKLQEELGQQEAAARQYKTYQQKLSPAAETLFLRKPQVSSAKACVEKAQASLDAAKLDLANTVVKAPYDGVISDKALSQGAYATSQSHVLTLVGTEQFWLKLQLPNHTQKWFNQTNLQDISVKLSSQAGEQIIGKVANLSPVLSKDTMTAEALITIDQPLAASLPIRVNDMLHATLTLPNVQHALAIDSEYLRNGNQVWILDKENNLDIREVTLSHASPESSLIESGLQPGDQVITTYLSSPVVGMKLSIAKQDEIQVAQQRETSR
ncbi:efflux RND transporter periplasmic adaptor subunit [Algicola sagamiensis]|uniref:efflux RND transporter periplasmic adaptor subunit n=1 Tax=Algicola sagamiensis TaxID=163869 RepID=UPI000A073C2D|nr:efflux RND transporter periplasmic adaptor subunit [Algicola sagamiensis]